MTPGSGTLPLRYMAHGLKFSIPELVAEGLKPRQTLEFVVVGERCVRCDASLVNPPVVQPGDELQ
jgi:hypothetical protein